MDVDFLASRVHSSKLLTAMRAAKLNSENHLGLDDYEGDDDSRECFPCPYCYVDIEVPVLCTHLQEEHCFDVKNTVCPLCAANLGKDMIGHFTLQHAHLLKRRRKSQKWGLWTTGSNMLGRELRELSSFLCVPSTNSRGNTPESAPDPLLSPFLCSVAPPETKVNQETCSNNDASTIYNVKSTEPSTSDQFKKQDYKEKRQKAEFFQHLIISTIF